MSGPPQQPADNGAILWEAGADRRAAANLTRFIAEAQRRHGPGIDDYPALYDWSIREPAAFWRLLWDFCGVIGEPGDGPWLADPTAMPGARWFPRARLNFAENLLHYDDDQLAIIARCERDQDSETRYTYRELRRAVAQTAAALSAAGVTAGDRVAGYLPNIPEALIAMLATASLGAIWSSCSPDFGTDGVCDRFGQIEPKVLFIAGAYCYAGKRYSYLNRVREVLQRIPAIEKVVVIPYLADELALDDFGKAVAWNDFLPADPPPLTFARLPFDHPLYILYSSGTTGAPKCIVHGAGGTLLQHLKELILHTDIKRRDRLFYFTTCGWMMWNWLASGLATGATVVLYDGSPFFPRARRLFDFADEVGITVFGTSAKSIAAWQKAGVEPKVTHRLDKLHTILSTGSPLLPEQFDYVYGKIKQDVCLSSISGGTDIVSCFALGNPLLPVRRGELQCRGLGMKVEIRDDQGRVVSGQCGELTCALPFPSMPVGFWNDPGGAKYRAAYFERYPGIWSQGDFAELTPAGGVIIYGRSDATLNPGGIRIGTAEIYRQVEDIEEVIDSVCVGQDIGGDQRVILFVRLRDGLTLDDSLIDTLRRRIRTNTTPRHVPALILQVADIPRTLSGKVSELAVRDVIHGRTVRNIHSLANPEALDLFRERSELQ